MNIGDIITFPSGLKVIITDQPVETGLKKCVVIQSDEWHNAPGKMIVLTEVELNAAIERYSKRTYDDYILENVRQTFDLEEDDDSHDQNIYSMSKESVFDKYCQWEGIIGYSDSFLRAIESIWDIKLREDD